MKYLVLIVLVLGCSTSENTVKRNRVFEEQQKLAQKYEYDLEAVWWLANQTEKHKPALYSTETWRFFQYKDDVCVDENGRLDRTLEMCKDLYCSYMYKPDEEVKAIKYRKNVYPLFCLRDKCEEDTCSEYHETYVEYFGFIF